MTSCGQEHLPVLCGHVNIVFFLGGGWGGKVIQVASICERRGPREF